MSTHTALRPDQAPPPFYAGEIKHVPIRPDPPFKPFGELPVASVVSEVSEMPTAIEDLSLDDQYRAGFRAVYDQPRETLGTPRDQPIVTRSEFVKANKAKLERQFSKNGYPDDSETAEIVDYRLQEEMDNFDIATEGRGFVRQGPDISHINRHTNVDTSVLDAYMNEFNQQDSRMDQITDLEMNGHFSPELQKEKRQLQAELLKVRAKIKELGGAPVSVSDVETSEADNHQPLDTDVFADEIGEEGLVFAEPEVASRSDDDILWKNMLNSVRKVKTDKVDDAPERRLDSSPAVEENFMDPSLSGSEESSEWARPEEKPVESIDDTEEEVDPIKQVNDKRNELILTGNSDEKLWDELEAQALGIFETRLIEETKNIIEASNDDKDEIDRIWISFYKKRVGGKLTLRNQYTKNRKLAEAIGAPGSRLEAWVEEIEDGKNQIHVRNKDTKSTKSKSEAKPDNESKPTAVIDSEKETPAENKPKKKKTGLIKRIENWLNREKTAKAEEPSEPTTTPVKDSQPAETKKYPARKALPGYKNRSRNKSRSSALSSTAPRPFGVLTDNQLEQFDEIADDENLSIEDDDTTLGIEK